MKIIFICSEAGLRESVQLGLEIIEHVRAVEGMYSYFPDVLMGDSVDAIQKQITQDMQEYNFLSRAKALQDAWNEHDSVFLDRLQTIALNQGRVLDEIRVVPTIYGPYGFFNWPNTVYVNVGSRSIEQQFETVLHESLHLLLEAGPDREGSDKDAEGMVDAAFVDNFSDIFPSYKVQKME